MAFRATRALNSVKILVVDSYARASRDGFLEYGLPLAGHLYRYVRSRSDIDVES